MTTYLKFQPSDRITLNLASNEAARTVVVVQNTSKCVRAWSGGRALRSALRPFFLGGGLDVLSIGWLVVGV